MIPDVTSITSLADTRDPKAVAAKVQSMFMEVMLKAMENSIGADDGLYGNSSTSEIYRGMFREQLGATLGANIGGSIQDDLEKAMTKTQSKLLSLESSTQPSEAAGLGELSGTAGVRPTVFEAAASALHGLPVAGVVTSEVGWRKDPITGALSFHKGTDIAAPKGTSIRAVASGIVVESGVKGEYGNAVVIQTDDGRRMLYGHNSANFVRAGERVEAGQTIAAVGATGRATGPHVHFEVSE